MLEILFARMLDKLGAGVVAADPNGPVLADNAGRKGRECHGRAQTCTYGLQGGGGAAEHGGVVAAGGTSILEVQRRMTCGAYMQVGAGAGGAEGSVNFSGMLLLRSYGCLFFWVLIWLVRNSLGGEGLPRTSDVVDNRSLAKEDADRSLLHTILASLLNEKNKRMLRSIQNASRAPSVDSRACSCAQPPSDPIL